MLDKALPKLTNYVSGFRSVKHESMVSLCKAHMHQWSNLKKQYPGEQIPSRLWALLGNSMLICEESFRRRLESDSK